MTTSASTAQLEIACNAEPVQSMGYYIFTRPHQVDFPPVKAFRDWLVKEAARRE